MPTPPLVLVGKGRGEEVEFSTPSYPIFSSSAQRNALQAVPLCKRAQIRVENLNHRLVTTGSAGHQIYPRGICRAASWTAPTQQLPRVEGQLRRRLTTLEMGPTQLRCRLREDSVRLKRFLPPPVILLHGHNSHLTAQCLVVGTKTSSL